MKDGLVEGASGRGAAGGDIRIQDVPSNLIDACRERLEELQAEKTEATPLLRKLHFALQRERLALPMISTTLSRVLGLLAQEEVAISKLALAVETDPALATKVVGVANSGCYGGVSSVVSVQDALMRTGLEQAKNIVAGVAIRSSVFQARGFEQVMDAIWQRSVATALATLALLENDTRWRETAFLLGLVHDVGRIVLLATAAIPLAKSGHRPSAEAIEAAGSAIRCELGAIALASWAFDDEMIDAVVWQEQPEGCPEASRPLTSGLYAGDMLVNLGMRGWRPGRDGETDLMVAELIEPLGFELQQIDEILQLVEGGMTAFTKPM